MNPWEQLGMTEEQYNCQHEEMEHTGEDGWMWVTTSEQHLYPTKKCKACGLVVFDADNGPKQTREVEFNGTVELGNKKDE